MLQFALEPLLLPIGGTAFSPQSLSIIAKMLRTLKRTIDVSPDPKTHNMCAAVRYKFRCPSPPPSCPYLKLQRQRGRPRVLLLITLLMNRRFIDSSLEPR